MEYYDKSMRKKIKMTEREGEFVVHLRNKQQTENLTLNLELHDKTDHIKPLLNDNMFLFKFNNNITYSTIKQKREIKSLQQKEPVKQITPVYEDNAGNPRIFAPDKLVVWTSDAESINLETAIPNSEGIIEQSSYGFWKIIHIPKSLDMDDAIDILNDYDNVRFSEPAYYGISDEESFRAENMPWNFKLIDIESAWEKTMGDHTILIAVIDGMPDLEHPCFNMINTDTLLTNSIFSTTQSLSSHATEICSLIIGKDQGFQGLSTNSKVVPCVVNLQAQYYYQRADALLYLSDLQKNGMFNGEPVSRIVANCSWKTSGNISIIREAINEATKNGVIVITSAGNSNSSRDHYPSDYSRENNSVISVAAIDENFHKSEYSNFSKTVSISAPGGGGLPLDTNDIICASLGDSYVYNAGTSLAAAHVTSAVALMLSINQELTGKEVKQILHNGAQNITHENPQFRGLLGAGALNIGESVRLVAENKNTSDPDDPNTDAIPPDPETPGPEPSIPHEDDRTDSEFSDPKLTFDLNDIDPTGLSEKIEQFIDEIGSQTHSELERIVRSQSLANGTQIRINGQLADSYFSIEQKFSTDE